MPTADQIRQAAASLFAEYQAGQIFTPLPGPWGIDTIPAAYAVQREYRQLLTTVQGPVAGYKLAYTTAVMQQQAGWNEPCSGALLAATIHQSPANLDSTKYQRLGMECEVAARLAADLPPEGAPYTRDTVAAAVDTVMAAFEVIDMRLPPGLDGWTRTLTSVATNISNAGAVLGPPAARWRDLDLAAVQGTAYINDVEVGRGWGSDVMGHPLEPLAWLANQLAAWGETLPAGSVVITGSIVPPRYLNPGDRAVVSVTGLGAAELQILGGFREGTA